VAAGDRTAVFRAIGDFTRLVRDAKRAKKEMGGLGDQSRKTGDDLDESGKKSEKTGTRLARLASGAQKLHATLGKVQSSGFGKWLQDTDTRTRGMIGSITKLSAKVAALSLIGTFATASVGPVLSLVGAIGGLSGAIGVVPGLYLAGAAAAGVLKVAFSGVSDVMKNLGQTNAEFVQTVKDLPLSLQEVAWQVKALKPDIDALKKSIQARFWEGLAKPIRALGERYIPILRNQGGRLASTMNKMAKEASAFALQRETSRDWADSLGRVNLMWENMIGAVRPLLQILTDIIAVSTEFLPGMGEGFAGAAQNAADFIREARESGKLKAWIQSGLDQLKALGAVLFNIGRMFGAVFRAGQAEGRTFFGTLRDITDQFADFLESTEGQDALQRLFQATADAAAVAMPIVKALFDVLSRVLPILVKIGERIGPGVEAVIRGIGDAITVAEPHLLRLGSAVGGLLKALGNAGPFIGSLVGGLADVLSPVIEGLTWLIKTLTDLFNGLPEPMQDVIGQFGGMTLAIGLAVIALNKLLSIGKSAIGVVGGIAATLNKIPGVNLPTPGQPAAPDVDAPGKKTKAPKAKVGQQLDLFDDASAKSAGDKTGKSFLSSVTGAIKRGASGVGSAVKTVFSGASSAASAGASGIGKLFSWAKPALATTIKAVGGALGVLATGLRALGAALLANPIVIIIAAIAAAAYLIITNWDTVKQWILAFWEWLKDLFTTIWNFVVSVWTAIADFFKSVWDGIISVAQTIWNAFRTAFEAVLNAIKWVWESVWGAIKTAAEWVWNLITSIVGGAIDGIRSVIETVLGVIRSVWDAGWKFVSDIITGVWEGIKNVVGGAVDFISDIIGGLVDTITWLWDQAKKVFGWIIDTAKSAIDATKEALGIATKPPTKAGSWKGAGGSHFSLGGRVGGRGNRDDVDIRVKPGEYVSPVATTKRWLPLLRALNPHDRGSLDIGSVLGNVAAQPVSAAVSVNVAAAGAMSTAPGQVRDVHVTQIVNNPLPEKPSETSSKRTGRAAKLGVLSALGGVV
jgi:phage-related protein